MTIQSHPLFLQVLLENADLFCPEDLCHWSLSSFLHCSTSKFNLEHSWFHVVVFNFNANPSYFYGGRQGSFKTGEGLHSTTPGNQFPVTVLFDRHLVMQTMKLGSNRSLPENVCCMLASSIIHLLHGGQSCGRRPRAQDHFSFEGRQLFMPPASASCTPSGLSALTQLGTCVSAARLILLFSADLATSFYSKWQPQAYTLIPQQ